MVKVTVVIPTFNDVKFLRDLLSNLDTNAEVVVVDDSRSTDNAKEVAEGYGALYIRSDGDVSHSRNFGAEQSEADYLLFLDADVLLWSITPIADLTHWLEHNPIDVGTGPIIQSHTTQSFHATAREFWRTIFPTLSGGYTLVRRRVFNELGGFKPRAESWFTWEDVDLDWRLKLSGYKVHFIPFPTIHRREFTWRLPNGIRIY